MIAWFVVHWRAQLQPERQTHTVQHHREAHKVQHLPKKLNWYIVWPGVVCATLAEKLENNSNKACYGRTKSGMSENCSSGWGQQHHLHQFEYILNTPLMQTSRKELTVNQFQFSLMNDDQWSSVVYSTNERLKKRNAIMKTNIS